MIVLVTRLSITIMMSISTILMIVRKEQEEAFEQLIEPMSVGSTTGHYPDNLSECTALSRAPISS